MIPITSGPTASGPTPSGPTASGPTASGPTASGPTASGIPGPSMALTPVNYITISGPVPDIPFSFEDDVMLKTEDELKNMDISSLMRFTSTLSTSMALEMSTVRANQEVQGVYSILKQLSQSTIDGLDTEIAVNTSMLVSYTKYGEYLNSVSTNYISTMSEYDRDIEAQLDLINAYNSTLSSYTSEYASSLSSVATEDAAFAVAATQYSTVYYTYLGLQSEYGASISTLNDLDMSLSTAVLKEQASYQALQESTMRLETTSGALSSLYTNRILIGSTLTQYRINESKAYMNYMSSVTGYSTISSMYTAAIANELYALSVSTATQKTSDYSSALEQFQKADLLYTKSIPSGSSQGNSALLAAKNMAQQRLQMVERDKIAAENATSSLQNLAGLANTKAYETMLLGYDATILAYATVEENMKSYQVSSIQAIANLSSIYEQSILDISTYTTQISAYSSLYESSLVGASTLFGYSMLDQSTINADMLVYNAVSYSISSLNNQYSTTMNSYMSSITMSTLLSLEYSRSMSNISLFNTLYTSSQNAVNLITTELYGPGGLLGIYSNTLFTNSSILNKEIIIGKIYDTEMKGYINLQDQSMYQYRESYCRAKLETYQSMYESNVFAAVQFAQARTNEQQSNAPFGTTVTPIAADLTVPIVANSYAQLNSMTGLINIFNEMYSACDTQAVNITQLSTSVSMEASAWSTLDFYSKAQFFSTPMISSIGALVAKNSKVFASAQNSTTTLLNKFASTQAIIDTKKVNILSGLSQYFSPADIEQQNTTISSFLIESINSAKGTLESQGIRTKTAEDSLIRRN